MGKIAVQKFLNRTTRKPPTTYLFTVKSIRTHFRKYDEDKENYSFTDLQNFETGAKWFWFFSPEIFHDRLWVITLRIAKSGNDLILAMSDMYSVHNGKLHLYINWYFQKTQDDGEGELDIVIRIRGLGALTLER